MPTIDELEAVVVAADDDSLPVSQNGIARRVSRSQLLAGTQMALSLIPGLLGRTSAGLGSPEPIAVGSGLSLSNGVLSGSPAYSLAALPVAAGVGLGDLVSVGQSGKDRSITVKALLSTNGADVSGQVVQSAAGINRRLSDWLSDAVAVEAFGAVGDGMTDDSVSIASAMASGRPVILGPKTYRVDGQLNVQFPAVLIGTPGLTVIRRVAQRGGAWIAVSAPSFVGIGVTFDAGSIAGDSWGVLLAPTCLKSNIRDCTFSNATGQTLGSGLTIQARDGLSGHQSSHSIINCVFQGNDCHGLWVQAACGATVDSCVAFGNGGFGINLDFNDPLFQQTIRQSIVTACRCWGNNRGISIGNYNATNVEPPRWGLENPDATDVVVAGNVCSGNSAYGIAVSGSRIQVTNNLIVLENTLGGASGLLCNAQSSTLACNVVAGPGQFGIDSGGSKDITIVGNTIQNCAVGINAGGSTRVRISDNDLVGNRRAITIFQVETDGRGANFGIACADVWIEANRIQLGAGDGGIFLMDGPERVEIVRNRFSSDVPSTLATLCWAHSDSAFITQNTWNGSSGTVLGAQANGTSMQLIAPEIFDTITVDSGTTKIDAILGRHQADLLDQVSFVRVINGGSGYSHANVVFAGLGSGAVATTYIRDGVIIGIAMVAGGNGYVAASTTATISGDGRDATLLPFVGVPLARDRRLTFRCSGTVLFKQQSTQKNWTNNDISIPAGGQIVWQAVSGVWQAGWFDNIDYVQPASDGSVSIKSRAGDIRLQPGAGGNVRFGSIAEPVGFLTSFGRGSPEGVVVAPPGSDYRDLNGGVGLTLWLKQTGNGSSGWTVIA